MPVAQNILCFADRSTESSFIYWVNTTVSKTEVLKH